MKWRRSSRHSRIYAFSFTLYKKSKAYQCQMKRKMNPSNFHVNGNINENQKQYKWYKTNKKSEQKNKQTTTKINKNKFVREKKKNFPPYPPSPHKVGCLNIRDIRPMIGYWWCNVVNPAFWLVQFNNGTPQIL